MSEIHQNLSPPQYTLYRKLSHSIGQTAGVTVGEPDEQDSLWIIDISARPSRRAVALAGILLDRYDFGGITVLVRVTEADGGPLILSSISLDGDHKSAAKEMLQTALVGNPYFIRVQELEQGSPLAPSGDLAVVFRPRVIQFWNDNLADPFGYVHYVAQDVFAEVIRSEFPGDVRVSFTTAVRK